MKTLLPGSTLGILGGGQLGRYLALAARRMGYKTGVLDPAPRGPAAQVCDFHVRAPVEDEAAALELAKRSDVLTLEWELIPSPLLRAVSAKKPVFPDARVLEIIQDRLVQKEFLGKEGFPQARFKSAASAAELSAAVADIGYPSILKRRRAGYDGKGQSALGGEQDLPAALELVSAPCVLEEKIDFEREISVVLARDQKGNVEFFPIAHNEHKNGILRLSSAPAPISETRAREARDLAAAAAQALGHVGVMAIEMFVAKGGALLINEIAPRVHNSGHYTMGACAVSQFEQHLRAGLGLPLAETWLLSPVVMANLLGDLWTAGAPRWEPLLHNPRARLYLYGKDAPRPGRKMGHFLLLGGDVESLRTEADQILRRMGTPPGR
ncbi:MAG: 5-(carboxyamino)imidazole ribonucleotide synthase [Elusimicrobia bacterium]|nr:5-(carboxyamino)imidazole ribonucleotide synthase [Elusimicrobiota bacterium]